MTRGRPSVRDKVSNRAGLSDYHISAVLHMRYNLDQTPGYDIRNANRNICVLLTNDLILSPTNNIGARVGRTMAERMYLVHSDTLDKISTICSLILFVATAFVYVQCIGSTRVYVHPDQERVDLLNTMWFQMMSAYAIPSLSGLVSVIGLWKWFKRTTIPQKSIEIMRVMPQLN